MSVDDKLRDPETKEALVRASEEQLEALRAAIAAGSAKRPDGEPAPSPIDGAYLRKDRTVAYVVVDGIPCFLLEARLELSAAL